MKVCLDRKIYTNSILNHPPKPPSKIFTNRLGADSTCFSANLTKINYTKTEQKACNLAKTLFEGMYRKDGVTPYFNHCEFVGKKLKEAGYDEHVVAAGFLHDVVEDIEGWNLPRIEKLFGKKVAHLVEEVSHKNPNADWDTKLKNYVKHLKTISPEGRAIAACDKMASLQDDIRAFAIEGPKLFDKLGATPAKQLLKHITIYEIIMSKKAPKEPIAREYKQNIATYSKFTAAIIFDPKKILSKNSLKTNQIFTLIRKYTKS